MIRWMLVVGCAILLVCSAQYLVAQDAKQSAQSDHVRPDGPPPCGEGRGPGGHHRPGPGPLMKALDLDANGELSAAEIAGASESLKALDANGDGKVTMDEILPPPPPPPAEDQGETDTGSDTEAGSQE
ncbi:MAG: hypothetical protein JXL80_14285 [Planctomycetes bacterium]|nr:hypothetical protein [Planctomycetota bacterium]